MLLGGSLHVIDAEERTGTLHAPSEGEACCAANALSRNGFGVGGRIGELRAGRFVTCGQCLNALTFASDENVGQRLRDLTGFRKRRVRAVPAGVIGGMPRWARLSAIALTAL